MGINENNLITCVQKEGKLSRLQLSDISLQRRSLHHILAGFQPALSFMVVSDIVSILLKFFLQHWSYSVCLGSSVAKVGEFPNYARPRKNTTCQQTEIDLI